MALSETSPVDEKFPLPACLVPEHSPTGPGPAKAEGRVLFLESPTNTHADRGVTAVRPATAGPLYLPAPREECSKRPISAKRLKEVLQAKKARKDKLFSRITFTQSDTKYYNLFPVQPAVGWWKSVLTNSNHSMSSLSRMVRSFDIPIPDTVFCSSTDCFYITNRPEALNGVPDSANRKKSCAGSRHGWLIKSDFSAAKLLETNLTARLQAEEHEDALQTYHVAAAPVRSFSVGKVPTAKKNRGGRRDTVTNGPSAGTAGSSSRGPVFYPAAVMKQMHYMKKDCNITKALDLSTFSSVASDSSVERVFQAFVRGKPRSRCQLTRVCWSASRAPSGYTLVNRLTPQDARHLGGDLTSQFCVSCDNPTLHGVCKTAEEEQRRNADPTETSFDIFPVAGATLAAASQVARSVFHFTQSLFKIWLDTLVVDLVRDAAEGTWYFIQVKSFTVRMLSPADALRFSLAGTDGVEDGEDDSAARARSQHLDDIRRSAIPAICHMCGLKHPKQNLTKVVNQRMMLETQHHMRKRGLDIFSFPHGGRLQLSCNYPVCSLCYSLYLAEKELIQAELDLAQALQQPLPHKDPTFFSFLGVLDAIQGSTQANDPYLLDLLRSFNNAPPRQAAPSNEEGDREDNGHKKINLQLDYAKEKDPLLAFVTGDDERRRSVLVSSLQQGKQSLSVTSTISTTQAAGASSAGKDSIFATGSEAPSGTATQLLPSSSDRPNAEGAGKPAKEAAAVSAAPTSSGPESGLDAISNRWSRPRTTSSRTFAPPPKQTLRGGEAVAASYVSKEERWRQVPPKLYQWRMMLFMHSLQDLPSHLVPSCETNERSREDGSSTSFTERSPQLALELKLFGSTTTLPLVSQLEGRNRDSSSTRKWGAPSADSESDTSTSEAELLVTSGDRRDDSQYIPIKRLLVLYLFSVTSTLQKIFQQETLHFRLLSSPPPDTSHIQSSSCSSCQGTSSSSSSLSTARSRFSGCTSVLSANA
ncbi:hypothetical protein CSUI_002769, partial [Cystoisospora suis]